MRTAVAAGASQMGHSRAMGARGSSCARQQSSHMHRWPHGTSTICSEAGMSSRHTQHSFIGGGGGDGGGGSGGATALPA